MARILIVEDEASMRRILSVLLQGDSHETSEAGTFAKAEKELASRQFDLVITDQKLPDGVGLDVVTLCRDADPPIPVLMITAYATVDLAVQAMRQGAFDFIGKPFEPDNVLAAVDRASRHSALLRENTRLRNEVSRLDSGQTDLLGSSPQMQDLREIIARAAPTDATVLIMGETGTGKELVARAIHRHSLRVKGPFIAVNCAALPESLLESQLFGHEKGAFTGADRARQGLFESAHKGTLFLDEAGDMPLSLQAKLLRVLVDGEIMRIGATATRKVDVRVLAATHRDLRARIGEGSFREDLYYRLAVLPLRVPPLRERAQDVPALADFFLTRVASDLKMSPRVLSTEALKKLTQYRFPGNVRELRNLIERAYILSRGSAILPADLPLELIGEPSIPQHDAFSLPDLKEPIELRSILEEIEVRLIRQALDQCDNRQAEAARLLGISRSDMNYKVKRFGLRDQFPAD